MRRRGAIRGRGGRPDGASRKVASLETLARIVDQAKALGQRVVFTNGCFDLLHPGHIQLLERAKRLGDLLIVAINSDRSVRMLKGPTRPIINQRDRALLVAALESVDYVTIFDEPTPVLLIDRLRPQVLVKGADWSATRIVGRETIRRNHGRVVRIPLIKAHSTTQLIERIAHARR